MFHVIKKCVGIYAVKGSELDMYFNLDFKRLFSI